MSALREHLSFGSPALKPHFVQRCCGSCHSRQRLCSATVEISSVWRTRIHLQPSRHMKTIGYLGRIDKLFSVPATTRNWNTILAVVRIFKDHPFAFGDS